MTASQLSATFFLDDHHSRAGGVTSKLHLAEAPGCIPVAGAQEIHRVFFQAEEILCVVVILSWLHALTLLPFLGLPICSQHIKKVSPGQFPLQGIYGGIMG